MRFRFEKRASELVKGIRASGICMKGKETDCVCVFVSIVYEWVFVSSDMH
jgi:hypothetical protein